MYQTFLSLLLAAHVCMGVILPLGRTDDGAAYIMPVKIGEQALSFYIDTGSWETWTITSKTMCFRGTRTDPCATQFGNSYVPGTTYTAVQGNADAQITYADQTFITGDYGYDNFFIGDFEIPAQRFITANYTSVVGFKPASGLLGLGYQIDGLQNKKSFMHRSMHIPRGFQDRVISVSTNDAIPHGAPVLDSLFLQSGLAPYFGMALSRLGSYPSFGGVISIGETPNLKSQWINVTSVSTSAPILKTTYLSSKPSYEFYTINVNGILIGSDESSHTEYYSASSHYFLDSGTTLNYVPFAFAAMISSMFTPPGRYISGSFVVDCDALPPSVGFDINSVNFFMNAKDYIFRRTARDCLSTFQPALGQGENILGVAFLKNVYWEVYRGEWEGRPKDSIWIAAREYYSS